jgi:methoxymalonate biosynthesis acyl carrier protein
MQWEDVCERVRSYLSREIRMDGVLDDDDLFARGIVTSLFAMQLVLFVESEFALAIENEDLDMRNFRSVAAISKFVIRKKNGSD